VIFFNKSQVVVSRALLLVFFLLSVIPREHISHGAMGKAGSVITAGNVKAVSLTAQGKITFKRSETEPTSLLNMSWCAILHTVARKQQHEVSRRFSIQNTSFSKYSILFELFPFFFHT